jgi:hypothetical protein
MLAGFFCKNVDIGFSYNININKTEVLYYTECTLYSMLEGIHLCIQFTAILYNIKTF